MTPLTRKSIVFIVLAPIVFVGSMLTFAFIGYKYFELKKFPFYDLYIGQINSNIQFSGLIGSLSGNIIQTIDKNKKKIIFTITGSTEEIKSNYEFPLNGLIGYDMCYENKYGQYCFGETK